MIAIDLIQVASYLYHNQPNNELRYAIYDITEGHHPAEDIAHIFTEEQKKEVDYILKILAGAKNNQPKKRRR